MSTTNKSRTAQRKSTFIATSAIGIMLALPQVAAADSTFLFDWSGQDFGNTASASGFITFKNGFPEVPAGNAVNTQDYFIEPFPGEPDAIADLSITVTGASSGNDTFLIDDYLAVSWWSAGSTLDLTTELVGQATEDGGVWGMPGVKGEPRGPHGEFGLVSNFSTPAPMLRYQNVMGTDFGFGDFMRLTSFRPIPEPGTLALLAVGSLMMFRRRKSRS